MHDKILELFEKNKSLTLKELQNLLKIKTPREEKELGLALNELEDEKLIYNNHARYHYIDGINWMVGSLRDINPDLYAVSNKDQRLIVEKDDSRIFMDRDEVLVKRGMDNKIVHVYKRGVTYVTGTFIPTRKGLQFRSDVDLHTSFDVINQKDYNLYANVKAVVKIVDYTAPLKVKIVRVLGTEDQPGVDVDGILYENEVRTEFGKKVNKELDEIPDHVRKKEIKDRLDLRELPTVTIDGESTKDFDDAISVEKFENGGWRLWVHIADVSHYVKEDGEIDEEAFKRGTSIYVADRVVPMLPFQLSNGICSLNPEVDRLTLSCCMDFDADGKMTDYDIHETVIHSDCRCTYGKVNEYLENPESVPEYKEVGKMLEDFSDLAKKLKEQTVSRGHIEFETREPYFKLDAKGKPVDIIVKDRGWAEQMIEEAMIAANVAVAHELNSKHLPGMYRVHETPDPEKVQTIINMAHALHVPCDLNIYDVEPKDIANFLSSIEDENKKAILSSIAVRAMQKARYLEENLGHYGLALDEYCHFTSPIRRYPDLLIHRMLKRHVIHHKNDEKTLLKDEKRMRRSSEHLSQKERDAVMLERAVNDLKSAQYMENKVGDVFEGTISGVASFGFFVELDNTVEGMVPKRMLDDFFFYDPDTMTLTNDDETITYALGQRVKVLLTDVNVAKRQITFQVLGMVEETNPDDDKADKKKKTGKKDKSKDIPAKKPVVDEDNIYPAVITSEEVMVVPDHEEVKEETVEETTPETVIPTVVKEKAA